MTLVSVFRLWRSTAGELYLLRREIFTRHPFIGLRYRLTHVMSQTTMWVQNSIDLDVDAEVSSCVHDFVPLILSMISEIEKIMMSATGLRQKFLILLNPV